MSKTAGRGLLQREIHINLPIRSWWLWLPVGWMALSCTTSIFLYTLAGFYARFVCDDYDSLNDARERGIIAGAHHFYTVWGGRVTSNLFIYTVGFLGPPMAAPVALGITVGYVVACAIAVGQLLAVCGVVVSRSMIALATTLFVGTFFFALPAIGQDLYWMSGSLTYSLPLLIFLLANGRMMGSYRLAGQPKGVVALWSVILLLLAFLASGCSEIYSVMQGSCYGLAVLLLLFWIRKPGVRVMFLYYLSSLIGSLVGLAVVATAPGNAKRASAFGPRRSLAAAWHRAVMSIARYDESWILHLCLVVAFVFFLLGLHASFRQRPRVFPVLLGLAVGGVAARLVLALCTLPTAYAQGFGVPYRAMDILFFVLLAWTSFTGLILGVLARPWCTTIKPIYRDKVIFAATMLGLWWTFPLGWQYMQNSWGVVREARSFAADWAERESAPPSSPDHWKLLSAWGLPDYKHALQHRDEPLGSPPRLNLP